MKRTDNITQRELEVLRLISHEFTNTEIAEKLYISVHTAQSHRKNLLSKLGVRNSAGLVRRAFEKQLLTLRVSAMFVLLLFFSGLSAQNLNLEVDGHVKIRGDIDIHNQDDSTSILIGKRAGDNLDFSSQRNVTALGFRAGELLTTGDRNTIVGAHAGSALSTGFGNTFLGYFAGANTTTTGNNTFVGMFAGFNNTTGISNTFVGTLAGQNNTTAGGNAFFGDGSGASNTTGSKNNFFGSSSGGQNTTGYGNAFFGWHSGTANTTGYSNSFYGNEAGTDNTTGHANNFFGRFSGPANTTGSENSFFGYQSGQFNTTGDNNTFLGNNAGEKNATGSKNTFIGYRADIDSSVPEDSLERAIAIGYLAKVACSNCAVIGGVGADTVNVGIGTISPEKRLHVEGDSKLVGAMELSQGQDATSILIGVSAGANGDYSSDRANTYVGYLSGLSNTTGVSNTYLGAFTGFSMVGEGNTFIGANAALLGSSGDNNTYLGKSAGFEQVNGMNNTFIGSQAGGVAGSTALDKAIAIGYNSKVACDNCAVIGDADTNLGIGTDSPNAIVQIEGDASASRPHLIAKETTASGSSRVRFINTNVDTNYWAIGAKPLADGNAATANFSFFYRHNDANSVAFEIFGDGDATLTGTLTENSDARLKTNIASLNNVLPKLLQLSAYSYDWKSNTRSTDRQIGLIAQEVQAAFPELVSEDSNGTLSVSYTRFVPLLIEAVGEQNDTITELKDENQGLRSRLDELEVLVQKLLTDK